MYFLKKSVRKLIISQTFNYADGEKNVLKKLEEH